MRRRRRRIPRKKGPRKDSQRWGQYGEKMGLDSREEARELRADEINGRCSFVGADSSMTSCFVSTSDEVRWSSSANPTMILVPPVLRKASSSPSSDASSAPPSKIPMKPWALERGV